MYLRLAPLIVLAILIAGCSQSGEYQKTLKIGSVFENGGRIPKKYTCDGQDISPPLFIEGIEKNAKSLVIICEDPDAPMGVFTHWIAWNVEVTDEIPENIPKTKEVTKPIKIEQGTNDFGRTGYNGPCPPSGEHRYFFKIYVLDTFLEGRFDKEGLLKAIEGHVIQYGEIYGVYSR